MLASTGVDSLDPKRAELALLEFPAYVCVAQAFLHRIFCDGPDVLAGSIVALCHFQDFLSARSAGDSVV